MQTRFSVKNRRGIISLVGIVSLTAVLVSALFAVGIVFRNLQASHAAGTTGTGSWLEDFNETSLNTNFWDVSNYAYGQGAIGNVHQGYFEPDRVSVNGGYLTLTLTQEKGQVGTNSNGIISRAGEIATNQTYGYGTYEWRMRTSSTASSPTDTTGKVVSGQISSGFTYVNNSQTELDFEIEGQYPNQAEMTTWNNPNPSTDPTDNDQTADVANISGMANGFKTYKLVWSPGEVKYYIDDALVADHTKHVPSAPANVLLNQWGTDSTDFGGLATVGTDRYLLVDWVRYTAPGNTPIPPSTSASTPNSVSTSASTPMPTSTPKQLPNLLPRSYEAEASGNTLIGSALVISCQPCSGGERVGNLGGQPSKKVNGSLQFNRVGKNRAGTYILTLYFTQGDPGSRIVYISVNGSPAILFK
jgi:beta-glucanase (GH16 family)